MPSTKEGHLMWYSFRQRLIEQYSNVPYVSDAMFAYSHLSKGDEEPTTHYLSRAKVLLECIHNTTKLSSIPGVGVDNLYLVRGLKATHIRRRVASEQDSWRMMEDVFNTISHIAKMEARNRIYLEPNLKSVPQVPKEWVQEENTGNYTEQNPTNKFYNGPNCRSQTNSSFSNRQCNSLRQYSSHPYRYQGTYQPNYGQRKLMCYYCKGEHHIRDCKKFTKDKAKYKLRTMDLAKKYKDKFRQAARKGNMTVSEESSVPESTFSVEQLLGNLRLSDSESD